MCRRRLVSVAMAVHADGTGPPLKMRSGFMPPPTGRPSALGRPRPSIAEASMSIDWAPWPSGTERPVSAMLRPVSGSVATFSRLPESVAIPISGAAVAAGGVSAAHASPARVPSRSLR